MAEGAEKVPYRTLFLSFPHNLWKFDGYSYEIYRLTSSCRFFVQMCHSHMTIKKMDDILVQLLIMMSTTFPGSRYDFEFTPLSHFGDSAV